MNIEKSLGMGLREIGVIPYHLLDAVYTPLDRKQIRRTRNIRLIPNSRNRRGGKYSYAEWAHVIGIFQTLMLLHLPQEENNAILDVGCGTGLLGISSEPFLGRQGKYVGIDVMKNDVEFCRGHYPSANFEFIHLDVNNPAYAPSQSDTTLKWPVDRLISMRTTLCSISERCAAFSNQGAKQSLRSFFLMKRTETALAIGPGKKADFI
jgi:SAM-dependent methyltransferase